MSGNVTLPDGRLVDSLKVVELKKELEVLGLDKNGLKKDLVRRLSAALSDSVTSQPSSEVELGEKVPDEMGSSEVESEKESYKFDAKSDQPSESDTDQEPDTNPTEELVGNIGGVSESKASVDDAARSPEKVDQVEQAIKMPTQEKVEPPIQTEVAAPQSEITKSPIAQDHTRGNSPPIVEVSVQLHEEEEDYGDEEEEEKVENTRKEEGVEKPVIAVNATPKTSPPEGSDGENSAFRKPAPPPPPSNPSVPAPVRKETRAVGFTVEAPERVNSAVEAKCPPSSLVYIRCLVRPFTAAQLSTMLETHFGRASELWLDRIKSTAVARFSNEEVATRCREGLDGCRWPSINPRILQCEFASEALLAWLKEHGEAGDKPPPRHLLGGSSAASAASTNETNDSSVERKRPEKSMDDTETMGGAKRRRLHGIEGVTKATEKEVEGRGKRDTRGEESSKSLDDLFKKTEATPSVYWLPLTDEAAAAQLKARKQTYLAESTRRPVPKRNVEERRRENRSPFTEEFGNGPSSNSVSNPLLPPNASAREKRPRERTPSPGNKRVIRERRRSPSPRRPRYANRTPSPRFGGSSFAASTTTAATAADSRHPPPPSPQSNYRRRTPLRR